MCKKVPFFLIIFLIFITKSANSNDINHNLLNKPFISIAAGPVWAQPGAKQTQYIAPQIEEAYVPNKYTDTIGWIEFWGGVENNLSSRITSQIGVAFSFTSSADLNGEIWDDGEPQFANHAYEYAVRQIRLAAKGRLLWQNDTNYLPWLGASVGIGFNNAHGYTNTPLIFEAPINPNFEDYTKHTFSYSLGIGLQKVFDKHLQIGIGYEFSDWGVNKVTAGFQQNLNAGIYLRHLYTNGLIFNILYI